MKHKYLLYFSYDTEDLSFYILNNIALRAASYINDMVKTYNDQANHTMVEGRIVRKVMTTLRGTDIWWIFFIDNPISIYNIDCILGLAETRPAPAQGRRAVTGTRALLPD